MRPYQRDLFERGLAGTPDGWSWEVVPGTDPRALALVDGDHDALGGLPHYSRAHPGHPFFTGPGREVVMVTRDGLAVWAATERRKNNSAEWMFRNSVFRRADGGGRASDLIRAAVALTRAEWLRKYAEAASRAPENRGR